MERVVTYPVEGYFRPWVKHQNPNRAVTAFGHSDVPPLLLPSEPSYSNPFTPQPVHKANPLHPDPGAHHLQRAARPPRLVQPPAQKRLSPDKAVRPILRHEELAAGVDGAEGCASGVPRRVDGGVSGQEEDLVGEEGEFAEGSREVRGERHEGESLVGKREVECRSAWVREKWGKEAGSGGGVGVRGLERCPESGRRGGEEGVVWKAGKFGSWNKG